MGAGGDGDVVQLKDGEGRREVERQAPTACVRPCERMRGLESEGGRDGKGQRGVGRRAAAACLGERPEAGALARGSPLGPGGGGWVWMGALDWGWLVC